MLYLSLRVSLFSLAVLLGVLVLIRAQLYDDPMLRKFLTPPEGCPMPCFMDIRPGVTQMSDAIDLLQKQAWVGEIDPHYIAAGTTNQHLLGWVAWDWNDDAPIWFRAATNAMHGHAGVFNTVDGVVSDITVATNVPFGSFRLMLGEPDGYSLAFSNVVIRKGVFASATLNYRVVYLRAHLQPEASSLCKDLASLWFKPGLITFFDDSEIREVTSHLIEHPFLSELYDLRQMVCRF